MGPYEEQIIKLTVAALFLVTAGGLAWVYGRRRRRLATWVQAPATVTRVWSRRAGSETEAMEPCADYELRTATGAVEVGSGPTGRRCEVGDVIEVRHDPARPERNQASFSDGKIWLYVGVPGMVLCLAIGLVALIDGVGIVDLGWEVTS